VKKWLLPVLALAAWSAPALAGPATLSQSDVQTYRQAFDALRQERYDRALDIASRAKDPLPAKLIRWAYLSSPNSGALFADITAFIRANPDWPRNDLLSRRAEEAISLVTPQESVLAWFKDREPVTAGGAMAYGRALIAQGQIDKAASILRDAWLSNGFGQTQEQDFLNEFGTFLTVRDQWERLDRLLWDGQDQAARRQMARVDPSLQTLAAARMALAKGDANAWSLVEQVPQTLRNDPGLIYQQLRNHRVAERNDQAIALLSHPSYGQGHPGLWWTERAILARRQLQFGLVSQAYALARDHGQTKGVTFADGEWLSGWIALRFLGDGQTALAHFAHMYERVGAPQSLSRAAYWAGRAAESLGRKDEAASWYGQAARHVTSFYGQLASSRIGRDYRPPLPAEAVPTIEEKQAFERHELVRLARRLSEIGEEDYLPVILLRLTEQAGKPGARVLTAALAAELNRPDIGVSIARRTERQGQILSARGYPRPRIATGSATEEALVLGLIRQESGFYQKAVSSVGARGLMQLMPATAEQVAKRLNISTGKKKGALTTALVEDPAFNVTLGSAFLGDLLDRFGGSYILAVAAYNAGPSRVNRWLDDYGDPRSPRIDPIDWIESIPYGETRNYVQRVLEGTQVYRQRLKEGSASQPLDNDLVRGRGNNG